MRFLLDTHTLLWFLSNDLNLSTVAQSKISDPRNSCLVSIASFWEIGIKFSLGKLKLETGLESIFNFTEGYGFSVLPISKAHILENSKLVFQHRDPFDRMLIAQARVERLKLISKDKEFNAYDVEVVW